MLYLPLRCAAGTVTAPQPVTFPQSVVKGLLASLLFALPALVTGLVEVQGGRRPVKPELKDKR
jgi:hypothetical protein